LSTIIGAAIFDFDISGSGVFSRSVDPSDRGLLCPRIAANKFSAGSDKTAAVWKLSSSVLLPRVRLIGSSGSDSVSDLCSGSVSGFVCHAEEEAQLKCLNGLPCIVGSLPTKLRESSSLSDSGVGVCVGGLNEKVRQDVVGSGILASDERRVDSS
jgi:hypothetical protein